MKKLILLTILFSLSPVGHSAPPISCVNQYIIDVLNQNKAVKTKVAEEFFKDKGAAEGKDVMSIETCFEIQKGDMFQVSDEIKYLDPNKNRVVEDLEIQDPKTKLYLWVKRPAVDFVGSQVKIKDSLLSNNYKKCFVLSPRRIYNITDIQKTSADSKDYKVKIQDPISLLEQWIPAFRLNLRNPDVDRRCPIFRTEKNSNNAIT